MVPDIYRAAKKSLIQIHPGGLLLKRESLAGFANWSPSKLNKQKTSTASSLFLQHGLSHYETWQSQRRGRHKGRSEWLSDNGKARVPEEFYLLLFSNNLFLNAGFFGGSQVLKLTNDFFRQISDEFMFAESCDHLVMRTVVHKLSQSWWIFGILSVSKRFLMDLHIRQKRQLGQIT